MASATSGPIPPKSAPPAPRPVPPSRPTTTQTVSRQVFNDFASI